jgi:hypothetical protein
MTFRLVALSLYAVAYFFGVVPPAVPPVVELVAPAPVPPVVVVAPPVVVVASVLVLVAPAPSPVYVAPPVVVEVEVVAPAPVPVFVVLLLLVVEFELPPRPLPLPERLSERVPERVPERLVPDSMLMLGPELAPPRITTPGLQPVLMPLTPSCWWRLLRQCTGSIRFTAWRAVRRPAAEVLFIASARGVLSAVKPQATIAAKR